MENLDLKLFKLNPYNGGELMEGLFLYQRNLVKVYSSLGRVPNPRDFDINKKENQKFLRGLMDYLTEELAEADQELDSIKNNFRTENYTLPSSRDFCILSGRKAMIELADSLHFIIELFIFLNIGPKDIIDYLKLNPLFEGLVGNDALISCSNVARQEVITNDELRTTLFAAFKMELSLEDEGSIPLLKISERVIELVELNLWALIKNIQLLKNNLKSKEWRIAEVTVTNSILQERAVVCFMIYCRILDILQITPKAIYQAYEDKNLVVQQRILDNY